MNQPWLNWHLSPFLQVPWRNDMHNFITKQSQRDGMQISNDLHIWLASRMRCQIQIMLNRTNTSTLNQIEQVDVYRIRSISIKINRINIYSEICFIYAGSSIKPSTSFMPLSLNSILAIHPCKYEGICESVYQWTIV